MRGNERMIPSPSSSVKRKGRNVAKEPVLIDGRSSSSFRKVHDRLSDGLCSFCT
jgi:hypothetical protein